MVVSVKNKIIGLFNVVHLDKLRFYRKIKLIYVAFGIFLGGCGAETNTPKPNKINAELTPKKSTSDEDILNKSESDLIHNSPLFLFETRIDSALSDSILKIGVLTYLESNLNIDTKLEQTDSRFNIKYLGSSKRLDYKFYLLSSLITNGPENLNRHSILVYFNKRLEARYIVKNSDYFPRSIEEDKLVFDIYDDEYKAKTYRFDFMTSPPPCLNFDNYSTCISKF